MTVRPIDGNELVRSLKNRRLHILMENENDGAAVFDDIVDWIKYTPTLTPPNEWVSVEDTVPDPGERVLATDGIFVGEAYRSSANSWFRHTGFPWRDGVTGRTVRFWMPLPAPPTKEN